MYTYKEITGQGEQLQKTLEIVENLNLEIGNVDQVLFTGCGTSYYIAASAAKYFQTVTGVFASAIPASELFLHTSSCIVPGKKYLIVAISRSGTTSEILIALDHLKGHANLSTMAITCNGDTPMATAADNVIALDHISEKSVVMTQSFSNMLYGLQVFAATQVNSTHNLNELKQVPQLVADALTKEDLIKVVAEDLTKTRIIFLGSGSYNGIAKEATLKLKEMTQTECESYSNLEFRHGPISIVDETTVVILMTQLETADYDQALVKDIQKLGGRVLTIGPTPEGFEADHIINLTDEISDLNRHGIYVPYLQLLAYQRAIHLGYNPDKPRNLTQVVKLS
ncbi:glucosamine--fructose-6-phosphate aminotransferase [Viridibacillus sp. FSL H7-0596]|uniref:SIS domain-containing protein n=1 Tax=Viridibacillus sp. FSL H7-0596 TaxID=1928923 RepID=UPI00096F4B24|nr:SIS domain-containing protein [Viridibacillus sp. FSL H7-0596]OMC85811.1 glucosamine--fructose-6-phosphate aminotransferase [Viridibacillus sp. FSL H7-0596]